jgi:hypothetical protein
MSESVQRYRLRSLTRDGFQGKAELYPLGTNQAVLFYCRPSIVKGHVLPSYSVPDHIEIRSTIFRVTFFASVCNQVATEPGLAVLRSDYWALLHSRYCWRIRSGRRRPRITDPLGSPSCPVSR